MNVFNHFILFFTFLNAISEFDTANKDYVTDSWACVVQLYAPNIRKLELLAPTIRMDI